MTIYFDYNATAPLRPEAEAAWLETVRERWGNPASVHSRGQAAAQFLETDRRQLAGRLHCASTDLIFNSGATEGANHVLRAIVPPGGHVVVAAIEHHAVLEAALGLQPFGVTVDCVDAQTDGRMDPQALLDRLRPDTALVALMAVNNETGVIQDVPALVARLAAANARRANAVGLLCDATQAVGKLPPAHFAGADWVIFSGHKFGAPKGVGAVIARRTLPGLTHGGNAEGGRRPGTVPVAQVHAMAAALQAAETAGPSDGPRIAALRDRLEAGIRAALPTAVVAGGTAPRVANTAFVCFPGLRAETLVMNFDLAGLCTSTGAACVQGAQQTSHVLAAMHLPADQIAGAVRFSLGASNTAAEVDQAVAIVKTVVKRLTGCNPR